MPGIAKIHDAIVARVRVGQLVDGRECAERGDPSLTNHALQGLQESSRKLWDLLVQKVLQCTQQPLTSPYRLR